MAQTQSEETSKQLLQTDSFLECDLSRKGSICNRTLGLHLRSRLVVVVQGPKTNSGCASIASGTLSSRLPWVLNVEARCHQRGDYKDGWREKLIALRIFFLCQSVENIAATVILSGWRYFAVT